MTSTITDYSRHVAGNVKAELARRDLTGADLIPILGLSKNSVYDRLRGIRSFEVNELAIIADHIGVPVGVLMRSEPVSVQSRELARAA